jgi:hypothetical protein
MEGITISDGVKTKLNICHLDQMVYPYTLKGKGKRYLFNFNELDMIGIIRFKLATMEINELFRKMINTK